MELPPKQYRVIYADPPWSFKTHSPLGLGRSADSWYSTMSLDDIKAMPVSNIALPDSVLLLWTTDPFLKHALDVIDSWGFIFKTVAFYWAKTPHTWVGTGYWTRANPEQCLLATHGAPRRLSANVPKLICAPRREHSRKPDEAYLRIERLISGPYIELFARQTRHGWDSLGDETQLGPLQTRRWNYRRQFAESDLSFEDIFKND